MMSMSGTLTTTTTNKILVCGWYFNNNLGDDLFIEAFHTLFPNYHFKFVNTIVADDLLDIDAVFIGGGSFLEGPLSISDDVFAALKTHKIFYIGVGTETEIHPMHQTLMQCAKLIAIRSPESLEKTKSLNPRVIVIPDLVYALPIPEPEPKIEKSVLVIPNISLIPKWNETHWRHVSWDFFKTEFCQFLDELIGLGFVVHFLPMSNNNILDDNGAAYEIINRMEHGSKEFILPRKINYQQVVQCISQYNTVLTQRYHGIILSDIVSVPCVIIHHHDKLKNTPGIHVPYYGVSKNSLMNAFNCAVNSNILPIDRDMFIQLVREVEHALCSH